jgi:hypothetical protein
MSEVKVYHVNINTRMFTSLYMYKCVCMCVYVCMYVCICVRVSMHVCMYVRTDVAGKEEKIKYKENL